MLYHCVLTSIEVPFSDVKVFILCAAVPGVDYEPLDSFPVIIPAGGFGASVTLDILINDNFTEVNRKVIGINGVSSMPRIQDISIGDLMIIDDDRESF